MGGTPTRPARMERTEMPCYGKEGEGDGGEISPSTWTNTCRSRGKERNTGGGVFLVRRGALGWVVDHSLRHRGGACMMDRCVVDSSRAHLSFSPLDFDYISPPYT